MMMMSDKIRLLIVDDHKVVREGIKAFILPQTELELAGEAGDGSQAVELAIQLNPDVILMDLIMPDMDGIQATREIKQRLPSASILILTSFAEDEKIIAAIRAGALGYLLKDSSPQELLEAVQTLHRGESYFPPAIARKLINAFQAPPASDSTPGTLTERENEILILVAHGLSNQEIADRLFLSPWTIRTHISSILGKLNVENRTQAALVALRSGLAKLDD
jgi:NarL family two-component system response regulator LiaR